MTSRTRFALATVPLLITAPALVACGGGVDAAHESCMGVASSEAARVDGVDASEYAGDYDLMSLCDELTAQYEDEGRVAHVVGCIGDYVERMSRPDAPIEWAGDPTTASKMADPMSVSVCL